MNTAGFIYPARFMGGVQVVPTTGTVQENPTHGLPILNPKDRTHKWPSYFDVAVS